MPTEKDKTPSKPRPKPTGRKPTVLKLIDTKASRLHCHSRRWAGLEKKAEELHIMTGSSTTAVSLNERDKLKIKTTGKHASFMESDAMDRVFRGKPFVLLSLDLDAPPHQAFHQYASPELHRIIDMKNVFESLRKAIGRHMRKPINQKPKDAKPAKPKPCLRVRTKSGRRVRKPPPPLPKIE